MIISFIEGQHFIFIYIEGRHFLFMDRGQTFSFHGQRADFFFSMDGAKIFFSHMVKARIFFLAKTRARIFFSKKTQAPPPGSLMVAPLERNAQMSLLQAHPQFSLANTSFGCALCQHTPTDLIPCKHIPVQISPKHVICTYFLEYCTRNHYQFLSSQFTFIVPYHGRCRGNDRRALKAADAHVIAQCLAKCDGICILWNSLQDFITGFLETRACLVYFGNYY